MKNLHTPKAFHSPIKVPLTGIVLQNTVLLAILCGSLALFLGACGDCRPIGTNGGIALPVEPINQPVSPIQLCTVDCLARNPYFLNTPAWHNYRAWCINTCALPPHRF